MNRQLATVAILIFASLTADGQTKQNNHAFNSSFININKLTVFQFIDLLKIDKENSKKTHILTIVGVRTSENWLKDKDIDSLMNLISSTAPAKCVMSALCSYAPLSDISTIGGQVMDIIEAYKDNKQYPTFLTSCAKTDAKRVEKIKLWWNGQKK
ncbi:hypothetical protein ABIB40_000846 [Pedobacter sp. UYP30]|uniref:hypothetical protein n=1 Tax=Pedobacter sp. UYP30 TaxID=1756400 RepID=UPI003395D4EA